MKTTLLTGLAIIVVFCIIQFTEPTLGCTQAFFLGPIGNGMAYTNGTNPVVAYHKNMVDYPYQVLLYEAGSDAIGGDYTYQHTFIGIGRWWENSYMRGLSAMNVNGASIHFANPSDPIGEDDYWVREKSAALADDFEELLELVEPESWPNNVAVTGYDREGNLRIGRWRKAELIERTIDEPFEIIGVDSGSGADLLEDTDNWFHGDPDLLEVRDIAYVWHRFNYGSDFAAISVTKHKILWLTAAPNADSPFIPFDLNDPYVYPAYSDGSYFESADYSQQEIDEIEDMIMAPDGSVIGDVRDIQMRIAEGMPIVQTQCEDTGGQCYVDNCDTYNDCDSNTGICSSGYCCTGTCESCTAHDNFSCFNGDVHWYDSCGNLEEKKEECDSLQCPKDQCVNCIDTAEISQTVSDWKNGLVEMNDMMQAIDLWKKGC